MTELEQAARHYMSVFGQALEALEMHAHGAGSVIHSKLAWDALREALDHIAATGKLIPQFIPVGIVNDHHSITWMEEIVEDQAPIGAILYALQDSVGRNVSFAEERAMIRLTTEQAQQIEEALEDIVRVFEFETGTPVEALATIHAARAQAQEPVAANCPKCKSEISHWSWCPDFVQPVSQKQKPVAWMLEGSNCVEFEYRDYHDGDEWTPLYAAPVQEPVAKVVLNRANQITMQKPNGDYFDISKHVGEYFYAAPVRTKDLTDDEIMDLVRDECVDMRWPSTPLFIARAVIDADREKNK